MQKIRKMFRLRKRQSPKTPDVRGGSQPPPDSSQAVVQAPALHAVGADTPAEPTISTTPPAASKDMAPSGSGLGYSSSGDNLASDGSAHAVEKKDDLAIAGDASKSSESRVRDPPAPQTPALEDVVRSAEAAYAGAIHFGERSSEAAQLADDGATAADDWFERIDGLLEKISAFSNMVSVIGELHPYAKIATSIIQAGLIPILKQKARDDAMNKLIDDMTDAYDVVMSHDHQLNGVKDDKNDPRCKLLARLAQQTAECAAFIKEHYETKNFYTRAIKTIPEPVVDKKIPDYSRAFVELSQKIAEREVSHIMDLVTTVSITETDSNETLKLQELEYAEGTGWQGHNACLPGTRTATLDSLAHWVFDLAAPRALFVVGVAGVGKSSIAHSIASRLEAFRRLGAFFAFDRTNQRLAPWSVFSTVARELADWNADFRKELSAVLSQKGRLAKSRDVIEQWEDLIVRPAQKVHFVGPVLIVIDAFDECTDMRGPASAFDRDQQDRQRARRNLLDCLTKRVEELPLNFRILVTSRLEEDVVAVADSAIRAPASCGVVFYDLSHADVEAHQSIELYIRHELHDSLGDEQIGVLVNASDRLFEWAATACRYLLDSVAGSTVLERYLEWFEGQAGIVHEASRSLELLYHTILGQRFTDKMGLKRFRDVMAQVLYAAEPVSWDTLVALRRTGDEDDNAVSLVIAHLGSLLSGVGEHSVPIRPLHTSFRDFLTRADVAHSWHVQPGDVHDVIALGALRVLNKSLHFNIWDFPSSYVFNDMIDDLDDRTKTLPAGLVYASRHWSYHLSMVSKSDVSLQTELRIFLTQKLLFWLEVVSLCNFMNSPVSFLLTAASFFKPLHDGDVIAFINDAISFVRNFVQPIQDSVPHIYLSALAFCPTTSLIRRSFVRNSNLLPTVDRLAAEWPVALCPHHVDCFAYSPDGIYVALGCRDGVVRLVDAENMHKLVLELARAPGGPSLWVRCVAFSPDGQIIAAAAFTGDVIWAILRWNAETGELLGIPHGHTDVIRSLCFSPDGRYIVSASDDQTVRRWDAKTGQEIGDPLRGHSKGVTGAVCSLNSKFIISAGEDATIRIWNADTGQQDGAPISPPRQRVLRTTLARSPKANLIAVGMISEDISFVWLFDCDQRYFVQEILRHRNRLPIIAWSYDGRHIASAFEDGHILLWDCFDSSSMALYTRTTSVNAISFSPDGNHLTMSLESGDLHTVDISAAQSQSSEYDTGSAEYAAYSPDGRYAAVTFQGKKFPSVWDAKTGSSISDDRVLTASLTWLKPVIDGSLQEYDWDGWGDRQNHRPHDIVSANGLRSAGVWWNSISIWDSASQTLLEPSIRIPSGEVTCIALSPSGEFVLQGSSDGTVRIFHVEKSAHNAPLLAEDSASAKQRSQSPEGERSMPVLRPGIFNPGWLYDKKHRQVICVPEQYRADLWLPGLVHILRPNREPARPVKIDVSGVGFGKEWTRCAGALSVDLGNAPVSSEPVANN